MWEQGEKGWEEGCVKIREQLCEVGSPLPHLHKLLQLLLGYQACAANTITQ